MRFSDFITSQLDIMKSILRKFNAKFFDVEAAKLKFTCQHVELLKKATVHIYTDGGARPNPGIGGWGWASYLNNTLFETGYGGEKKTTNNRMELMALIKALKVYSNECESRSNECESTPTFHPRMLIGSIRICTDSTYVCNSLVKKSGETLTEKGVYTGWMKKWKKDNWVKPPKQNIDLFKLLDGVICNVMKRGVSIKIVWVKGHSGVEGNELADSLAGLFSQKCQDSTLSLRSERCLEYDKYVDHNLKITFHERLVSDKLEKDLIKTLKNLPWKTLSRRTTITYGNKGLIYVVKFWNRGTGGYNVVERPCIEWSEFPALEEAKNKVEEITGDSYTCCAVQRYPNGKFGINPHQDKEMVKGTTIAGLSLGQTRQLKITDRYKKEKVNLTLKSGSLYILHPPTNSHYFHSIPKDSTTGVRYSLTFRNYIP